MKNAVRIGRMILLPIATLLLLGSLLFAGASFSPAAVKAQSTTEATPVRTIKVVGEGKVTAKPDIAQTSIGVEITGATVKEASAEANRIMEKMSTALKAQGVLDKDIQTSGYSIWVERPVGQNGAAGKTIYHVSNNVNVTIRDLAKAGTVIDGAIEAGANTINGINFSLADPAKSASDARAKAIINAKAKAEEIARLNGVKIGEIISISEVIGGNGYYNSVLNQISPQGMGGGAGAIAPGELEISMQMEITYAIQ
jgi:uncharacterized protein